VSWLTQTKTEPKNWFIRHAESEAKKDVIPTSERWGNIVGLIIIFLVFIFFVAHQVWQTGFFTSSFGTVEMFLFYAALLFGIVTTSVRGVVGRKNVARLFDAFGGGLFFIALVWLYVVFPFNFAHFADPLPRALEFLLRWITDDIARVLMILGLIGTPIMMIYNALMYTLVRRELSKKLFSKTT
jgi:hypothetical protein